ncbi:MAG: hypothetical protein OXI11_13395 [Gammaproteobacteria bacterium]|nr:hypothetical protein [Gammaproteobacteria bacterium]
MILGLPVESFAVQIVLPAIVIAAMFVASYRGSSPWRNPASHRDRRDARLARREEREY